MSEKKNQKNNILGVPVIVQWEKLRPVTMRLQVQCLALISGSGIQCCCEVWYRSQMRLRSRIAMAVVQANGYSSDLTPSLGTPYATGVALKSKQTKNKKIKFLSWSSHRGTVETNPTRIHEYTGLIPGLTQWVGDLALP